MSQPNEAKSGDSNQPGVGELIALREAAELYDLSAGHLRLLVSRGKLWGKKIGRNWVTTTRAVEEYIAKGHRPGPKPKKPAE